MDNDILISAKGLSKSYGAKVALKPTNLEIPKGRIVGVIGANGAGKSTLLNCILGLSDYVGELNVLGLNPLQNRSQLMNDVCFIADIATLPKWARISDLFNWLEDLHPKFQKQKAIDKLKNTNIPLNAKIKELSKGMNVQVHLSIVLAIDAKVLVLDEPTLGLDIMNRRAFYDAVLRDFFDEERTILVTTHQIDEIEPILSHAIFIKDGEVTLDASLEDISEKFYAIDVSEDKKAEALSLMPIYSRAIMGRTTMIFRDKATDDLKKFGEPRRVALADLFVALATPQNV
ncbi:ABC transporter ATP-binding protein [Pseudaquidulcibacter saccharophilus]|uniref:ABC transporter ATP-binding protein n=1 Tax=Pseudaquidulcibacter saccharophilus TaxID=2831900 RepID=UPI001EFF364E|nr:ABC transporter ATP-binding protein [Pseudaquidulcibacter saccharophilus]